MVKTVRMILIIYKEKYGMSIGFSIIPMLMMLPYIALIVLGIIALVYLIRALRIYINKNQ